MARILIVDAQRNTRESLSGGLRDAGHHVVAVAGTEAPLPELVRRLFHDVPAATPTRRTQEELVGRSAPMQALAELIANAAPTDSPVLVTGEAGTGKELVARALHRGSRRRDRSFLPLDVAAFPETLFESELFGHRRGAFPGASQNRRGALESASGGTVFLDQVAELAPSLQAKLLRFLQSGEIRPVGGDVVQQVDVRVVAATSADLEQEVRAGRFRADLYYRLAVIPIHVPPLRARKGDVELLARHFLARFADRFGRSIPEIEPRALALLAAHDWPGNVRELENSMERGVALCRGAMLSPIDLPVRLHSPAQEVPTVEAGASLDSIERRHILATLERVGWNRRRAAELLQISTTTLWRRLKVFGLEDPPRSSPARIDDGTGLDRFVRAAARRN